MNTSAISGLSSQAVQFSDLARASKASPAKFSAAAMRNASPTEQSAAVAAQFEAILVRQMLGKTMNSMLGGEEGGVAGSVYGDMLSDTFAQQLTSGPGLGLSRFIQQQLSPRAEKNAPVTGAQPANSATEVRTPAPSPLHS